MRKVHYTEAYNIVPLSASKLFNAVTNLVLLQFILNYLFEVVEILYETDVKSADANGRRMASALTIICCFHKIVESVELISFRHIAALLSMFRLKPDTVNEVCDDWDFVNEMLTETMRKAVFDATLQFIIHLSRHEHFFKPEWLFALPVLHFLYGRGSHPFQPLEYRPKAIPWGDQIIGLEHVKGLIKYKEKMYVKLAACVVQICTSLCSK